MRRLLASVVLLALGLSFALLCAGCGVRPSGVILGDAAPTGPVNGVTLFFVRNNQLVPSLRATDTALTPAETVSLLVTDGVNAQEGALGLRTDIPPGLAPVDITTNAIGTTLVIATDPHQLSTMAVNQLLCTARTALASGSALSPNGFFIIGPGSAGRIGPLGQCPETN